MSLKRPGALRPGARVAVVAPAGWMPKRRVTGILERLSAHGFQPVDWTALDHAERPFAAKDSVRRKRLERALLSPDIDWVFAARGGYGINRIVDDLAWNRIRRARPKLVTGFSDISRLLLALHRRAGWQVFHAPMGWDFRQPSSANLRKMLRTLAGSDRLITPADARGTKRLRGTGRVRGTMIVANLALLQTTVGTEDQPNLNERILFVEDIDEPLYRIERMLLHLRAAGLLDSLKALVVGRLVRCRPRGLRLPEILKRVAPNPKTAILFNYPFGHGIRNPTLPLGGEVELDLRTGALQWLDPLN